MEIMATAASQPRPAQGAPEPDARPARRLVLCFDGTWNSVQSRTNVSRLFEAILDRGPGDVEQLKFYDEGVGAAAEATTPLKKMQDGFLGGVFGDGIQRDVLQAYCWLIEHYGDGTAGDQAPEIFIFGFSRGAFSARLLAGLLGACGVLRRATVVEKGRPVAWDSPVIQRAWTCYKPGASTWGKLRQRVRPMSRAGRDAYTSDDELRRHSRPVPVKFLGVWDTVGKYGVPTWSWGNGFFKPIRFGDSLLGRHVQHARQAMAIDERRADFNIRLWEGASRCWASDELERVRRGSAVGEPGAALLPTDIWQRWFCGAHAQVGGGYENDQLCHHPLQWMAEQAAECGLELRRAGRHHVLRFAPLARDHLAPIIDSHRQFMGGFYRLFSSPIQRQVRVGCAVDPAGQYTMKIDVDQSVADKVIGDASYRPANLYHQGRLDLHALADTR